MNKKYPPMKDGLMECEMCGKCFGALGMHVLSHGISIEEYRAKFGYGWGVSFSNRKKAGHPDSANIIFGKITHEKDNN